MPWSVLSAMARRCEAALMTRPLCGESFCKNGRGGIGSMLFSGLMAVSRTSRRLSSLDTALTHSQEPLQWAVLWTIPAATALART